MRYEWQASGEKTVLQHLRAMRVTVEAPCSGKGLCGKCLIKVLAADQMPEPTHDEKAHLSDIQLGEGYRLACLCRPKGWIQWEWAGATDFGHAFLSDASVAPNRNVEIAEDAEPNETTSSESYGIAIDIGTTTVVANLINLGTGREVVSRSALNQQKAYGLDVISRIAYQSSETDGIETLHQAVVQTMETLIADVMASAQISYQRLSGITIAANTAMLHFLLRRCAKGLGRAPYESQIKRSTTVFGDKLGLTSCAHVPCYLLPPVSAYIGGDISAGILSLENSSPMGTDLFIDIGTNGELVLFDQGKMTACSCAAGPAFEGMNLSCGMRAEHGAVEAFALSPDGSVQMTTIGNQPVKGLCGSGVFDLLSEVIRVGLVSDTGRIPPKKALPEEYAQFVHEVEGKRYLMFETEKGALKVSQQDLRQIQLAKAAIRSGIEALLHRCDRTFESLGAIWIAGQFGKHIRPESFIGSGILPPSALKKLRYIGNSALSGAQLCLVERDSRVRVETRAKEVAYLELATLEGYERLFVSCMTLKKETGTC